MLRNGRGYCVRRVDVWQEDRKIVFSCICSFKQTEEGFLDIQEPELMEKKYAKLLHGQTVEELTKGEFADMTYVFRLKYLFILTTNAYANKQMDRSCHKTCDVRFLPRNVYQHPPIPKLPRKSTANRPPKPLHLLRQSRPYHNTRLQPRSLCTFIPQRQRIYMVCFTAIRVAGCDRSRIVAQSYCYFPRWSG